MYEIVFSSSFKRDYKRIKRRGYDLNLLAEVFGQLIAKGHVDSLFHPHKLVGNYAGCWECHLQADWLLVWKVEEGSKVIQLIATGTHSDLF
jgi:mRNA interferase YafQ